MESKVKSKQGLLFCLLIFLFAQDVEAVPSSAIRFIESEIGNAPLVTNYEYQYFPKQNVNGASQRLSWHAHKLFLVTPVWQQPKQELSFFTSLGYQQTNGSVLLPDTARAFPNQLWNPQFGPAYRYAFANGSMLGGNLRVGSPSDKPFNRADLVAWHGNLFYRLPQGSDHAWIFFLNYSTTRDFVSRWPLPGVIYSWKLPPDLEGWVGVPFTWIAYQPIRQIKLRAAYTLIRSASVEFEYRPWPFLWCFTHFKWKNQRYLLSSRSNDGDKLNYYDKTVAAGIRSGISRQIGVDLFAGYRFDRFFFEGGSYSERQQERIDLSGTPFVQVRLSFFWRPAKTAKE